MVNDSIEELMDWDMEPKPESLRWTSIFKDEGTATLRVSGRGKTWDLPFGEVFDVPGYRFHHDGQGFQGAERTMCKCLVSWWRDRFIYRSKTVPMIVKCWRGHGHVYSTALTGSINWPSSGAMLTKVLAWKANILHLTFVPERIQERAGRIAGYGPLTRCASNGRRWVSYS